MTWPKKTYLPTYIFTHLPTYLATQQTCRLVTIETLITILTIENLNSWKSFTWQSRVTLDSIRNSCDVFVFLCEIFFVCICVSVCMSVCVCLYLNCSLVQYAVKLGASVSTCQEGAMGEIRSLCRFASSPYQSHQDQDRKWKSSQ